MTDYLKYWLAPVTQLVSIWGYVMGGDFVWIAIAWFPLLAILDTLLERDMSARTIRNRRLAYLPIWLTVLLGPSLYIALAWSVGHHALTGWQIAGAVIGAAWMSVLPLVPAAHELYHARGAIGRTIARYSQICFLDPMRMEAHVVGHHLDVATPIDTDTAERGKTLYNFAPRAVKLSTIQEQMIECDALEKRGFGRWSIRHKLWRAILSQVLFQSLMFWLGGWTAVAMALGAMVIARYWVETFNYFQHYGLIRLPGAPIERRHVWNHLGPLSRVVAFEITNHADHHMNTYQPYYQLVPDRNSVPMPSVFVCFLAALIPPLWFNKIIKPALKTWDAQFANPQERALALAQNQRAGW
jgi:p-cymene methyl-monooxygenase